jgi:organic hydroperoxide reductase OsmC/OhrA
MSEQTRSGRSGSGAAGPREVSVSGNAERFTQEIVVGPHQLTADEPKDMGGDDEGPTPYDLLLAALGSCTSITVTMYAQNKSWPHCADWDEGGQGVQHHLLRYAS